MIGGKALASLLLACACSRPSETVPVQQALEQKVQGAPHYKRVIAILDSMQLEHGAYDEKGRTLVTVLENIRRS